MKHSAVVLLCTALVAVYAIPQTNRKREIKLDDLHDRIAGGWAGQMIGVSYGAPTEFKYREQMIEGALPEWRPERVSNAIDQDDLYVDMTFAKVLDEKGINATTDDFGAMFREARYSLWHANLAARRALKRGVPATLSGTPQYNAHANDIDFQIESDFIGLMCPGMPRSANEIAYRAGQVMNHGDGLYGGMFVSGMYAAAFFETDTRRVVQAGLASIPPQSPYAQVIRDVLAWSQQNPDDWKAVWRLIEQKWNRREPCPEGALRPFNIDAKLNGAYIALGLLYGKGDFDRTIDVATRSGQDSDCNPSNACGILGTMIGYHRIPDKWKSGIAALADQPFRYTDFSFHSIVESTQKRAIALVRQEGGKLEGDRLLIETQAPAPKQVGLWDDYGSPAERVAVKDARWHFSGNWREEKNIKVAAEAGATAEIEFQGTGVIVVGPYLPSGGQADIYLDGRKVRTVDVYPDENQRKNSESVWHAFHLKSGEHTVKVSVRGETYGASQGTEIGIEDLVVFR